MKKSNKVKSSTKSSTKSLKLFEEALKNKTKKIQNKKKRKRKPSTSFYGQTEKYEYKNTSSEISFINNVARAKGLSYGQMTAFKNQNKLQSKIDNEVADDF